MNDRLKLNLRETLIYEIGHTAGMVKREREVQQEIFNYECMHNIKYQDASNGIRLKLHSDYWFAGMRDIIGRCIELINQHSHEFVNDCEVRDD